MAGFLYRFAIVGILLGVPTAGVVPAQEARPSEEVSTSPCRRVVVLGASVSAGFGTSFEADGTLRLADVLDRMITVRHERVRDASTSLFFVSPRFIGAAQVRRARRHQPSMVIAVDYLFWYAYGRKCGGERARLRGIERGLRNLDRFRCPVVVSRLPDMSDAVVLGRRSVPHPGTLERINDRIQEWSEARPDVVLVPLDSYVADLRAGREVTAGASTWSSTAELLQRDRLHVTVQGLAVLGAIVLDNIAEQRADVVYGDLRLEPREIAVEILDQSQPRKQRRGLFGRRRR